MATRKKVRKKKGSTQGAVSAGRMPNGKGNSSIVRDAEGLPEVDPPRHKSLVGSAQMPDTEGKKYLETEKIKSQIEILMLKGVTDIPALAALFNIAYTTAKRYVEEVKYRWAALGPMPRMLQRRGQAERRLDLIESELWQMFSNSDSEKIKVAIMSRLISTHDRRMLLHGMTDKTVMVIGDVSSGRTVEDRMREHGEIMDLVTGFAKFMKKRQEQREDVIDADYSES